MFKSLMKFICRGGSRGGIGDGSGVKNRYDDVNVITHVIIDGRKIVFTEKEVNNLKLWYKLGKCKNNIERERLLGWR